MVEELTTRPGMLSVPPRMHQNSPLKDGAFFGRARDERDGGFSIVGDGDPRWKKGQ